MSDPGPKVVKIDVYSRPGCHLCDEAKELIERVQRRYPFELEIINVETDPKLKQKHGSEVPVVFINGSKAFKYRIDEADFIKRIRNLWNP